MIKIVSISLKKKDNSVWGWSKGENGQGYKKVICIKNVIE